MKKNLLEQIGESAEIKFLSQDELQLIEGGFDIHDVIPNFGKCVVNKDNCSPIGNNCDPVNAGNCLGNTSGGGHCPLSL